MLVKGYFASKSRELRYEWERAASYFVAGKNAEENESKASLDSFQIFRHCHE